MDSHWGRRMYRMWYMTCIIAFCSTFVAAPIESWIEWTQRQAITHSGLINYMVAKEIEIQIERYNIPTDIGINNNDACTKIQQEIENMGLSDRAFIIASTQESPIPAFAAPSSNQIVIDSRLVNRVTDDTLRGIIAHEATHLIEKHGQRKAMVHYILTPLITWAFRVTLPYILPRWWYFGAIRQALEHQFQTSNQDNCATSSSTETDHKQRSTGNSDTNEDLPNTTSQPEDTQYQFNKDTQRMICFLCNYIIPAIVAELIDAYFSKYCEYRADRAVAQYADIHAAVSHTNALTDEPTWIAPYLPGATHPSKPDRIAIAQECAQGTHDNTWNTVSRIYRMFGKLLFNITDYCIYSQQPPID